VRAEKTKQTVSSSNKTRPITLREQQRTMSHLHIAGAFMVLGGGLITLMLYGAGLNITYIATMAIAGGVVLSVAKDESTANMLLTGSWVLGYCLLMIAGSVLKFISPANLVEFQSIEEVYDLINLLGSSAVGWVAVCAAGLLVVNNEFKARLYVLIGAGASAIGAFLLL